jgi:DMSO/TMAO reductase YedYZ molybdopterin-dependent catalytic subunit
MSFFQRNRAQLEKLGYSHDRLPPGQYYTKRFPVLHVGDVPRYDMTAWDLRVFGLVRKPMTFSFEELRAARCSPGVSTAPTSRPSTAGRCSSSFRASTSGSRRSGCAGSELVDHDEPGFWERNGYHNDADPWRDQRYWGD